MFRFGQPARQKVFPLLCRSKRCFPVVSRSESGRMCQWALGVKGLVLTVLALGCAFLIVWVREPAFLHILGLTTYTQWCVPCCGDWWSATQDRLKKTRFELLAILYGFNALLAECYAIAPEDLFGILLPTLPTLAFSKTGRANTYRTYPPGSSRLLPPRPPSTFAS